MAIAGAMMILSVFGVYTSFDMLSRLQVGDVYQDTLFHASIAAMIKNYGVASTGLHGSVQTPYHTLSHALIAGVSLLSGAGVFEAYGVAPWVFFAPILVFSAVTCSTVLDRTGRLNMPLAWGLTSVLLIVVPILLTRWGVWRSFLISESYLVSLGLLLAGFPLLFKRRLSAFDLLLIPILTALIANAKASVGVVFAVLWLARVLFVRSGRVGRDVAAFALSAVVAFWVTFHSAEANQEVIRVLPFDFVATHLAWGEYINKIRQARLIGAQAPLQWTLLAAIAVLSFLAFHFLLTWAIVVRVVRRQGVKAVFADPLSVYALAATAVGVGIVALFTMGSSVYYFSSVAFFVALPGVVVLLAYTFTRWKVSPYILLVSAILLTGLLMARSLSQDNAAYLTRPQPAHSAFVDALLELRRTSSIQTAFQLMPAASAFNPVSRCTAQPFVYPAVSERPWINAIPPGSACPYQYYAYDQYGIVGGQQAVTVQTAALTAAWWFSTGRRLHPALNRRVPGQQQIGIRHRAAQRGIGKRRTCNRARIKHRAFRKGSEHGRTVSFSSRACL